MAGVKQRPLSDIGPQADTQEHESQTRKSANVRYRFLGLMRSTGKPVEGHVEADSEEWAFHALANNGIITESLRPDPAKGEAARAAKAPEAKSASPLLPPMSQSSAQMVPLAPVAPVPPAAPARPPVPPGAFSVGTPASSQTFAQQPPAPPGNGNAAVPGAPRTQFDNALEGALD